MSRPAVDFAKSLIRRKKYGSAISVLESARDIYRDSFDYYLILGVACLYAGDVGNANKYFQQARHIRIRDTKLLLGQAALYLRRGDTDLAISYYLEIQELDPENKIAREAMEFIRTKGDFETILKWVDSGKIERFYPTFDTPLSDKIKIGLSVAAGIAAALLILTFVNKRPVADSTKRADLSELVLSVDDLSNLQEKDLSGGVYRYILTDKQIEQTYNSARQFFQDYKDNSARVQINRLLNSNASSGIKAKANLLLSYFEEPTFDTFEQKTTENFIYSDVASDPVLYLGCWIAWSGRISNALIQEDSYRCDLLIGYEELNRVDGIVPVYFSPAPVPDIEGDRAVKILAKIGVENGKLALFGRSVYQPLRKNE